MVNIDRPRGLLPVDWNGACKFARRYMVAGDAGAIAVGDLVEVEDDQTAAIASTDWAVIDRSAAGSANIVGVALWFSWVDAFGVARWGSYYDAASTHTKRYAYVVDDPMVRFLVQSDSDTSNTATQRTMLHANADHVDTAPSQTGQYTGHSNHELDSSSMAWDASCTLRMEEQYPIRTNAFGSSTTNNLHGQFIVRIHEHFRAPGGTIAGPLEGLVPLPAMAT